jgi:hypothetical protein
MRRRVKVGKSFDLSVQIEESTGSSRRIAVGEDFDAKITISGDVGDAVDAITRSRMVWVVFAVMALFLFGAAGYGMFAREFSGLWAVWGVTGPIYTGIAGYFFRRPDKRRGTAKV